MKHFDVDKRYKFDFLDNGVFVITDKYCEERISIPFWVLATALTRAMA